MSYDVQPYLFKSVEELKDVALKKEIILNDDHYVFVHFCQMASNEQLQALLDENGIEILSTADRLQDKLNALLSSRKGFTYI